MMWAHEPAHWIHPLVGLASVLPGFIATEEQQGSQKDNGCACLHALPLTPACRTLQSLKQINLATTAPWPSTISCDAGSENRPLPALEQGALQAPSSYCARKTC